MYIGKITPHFEEKSGVKFVSDDGKVCRPLVHGASRQYFKSGSRAASKPYFNAV